MKPTRRSRLAFVALIALIAVVPTAAAGRQEIDDPLPPLVVGIMPAVDSIPLIVAAELGLFEAEGVRVDLELFRDQLYREASLQAGRIDATVSDLVNAIRSWHNGADYRVIASTQGRFAVVTSARSGIRSIADWPRAPGTVETGLIDDSIINYTAERMLAAVGADPGRVTIIPTLQIPVRLELVVSGALDAAVLPEPLTRLAEAQGATVLVESDILDSTPGVILATGAALAGNGPGLAAFLRAYDRGAAAVNADPDRYRDAIVAAAGLPPQTAALMRIPVFTAATLPPAAVVDDVAAWMLARGLISRVPTREQIVAAVSR